MGEDLQALQREATQLTAAGQYREAVAIYKKLVGANRDEIGYFPKIAELCVKLGKDDQAINWYEVAAKRYAEQGQLPKAISVAKIVLELDPERREIQNLLAKLYGHKATGAAVAAHPAPVIDDAEDDQLEIEIAPEDEVLELGDEFEEEIEEMEDIIEGTVEGISAEQLLAHLPRVPIFTELTQDEFLRLIDHVSVKYYEPGDFVVTENDPGDAFYIMTSGEAVVIKENFAGAQVELATLNDGAFFGEFAYLTGSNRTASVMARTPVELLELSRVHLDKLVHEHPRVKMVMQNFFRDRVFKNVLAMSPLFTTLDDVEKKAVVGNFAYLHVQPGTVIIKEGGEGQGLFIVVNGHVEVSRRNAWGGEDQVAELKTGEFFGEMSLLNHGKTTASVTALTQTVLFKLPKEQFDEVVKDHPKVLRVLQEFAAERRLANENFRSDVDKLGEEGLM